MNNRMRTHGFEERLREKAKNVKLTLKPTICGKKLKLEIGKIKCPFRKKKIWGFKISFRF